MLMRWDNWSRTDRRYVAVDMPWCCEVPGCKEPLVGRTAATHEHGARPDDYRDATGLCLAHALESLRAGHAVYPLPFVAKLPLIEQEQRS